MNESVWDDSVTSPAVQTRSQKVHPLGLGLGLGGG